MKVGFYHSCFMNWDLERTFAWAQEHDFHGIELHGGPRYEHIQWADVASGKDSGRLLRLQEEHHIPITGIMFGAIPFLSPDKNKRAEALETITTLIKAASNIGIKVVSTFTGRDPNKTLEENLDLFEQVFPRVAEIAEKNNVTLAFENCPMYEFWPYEHNIAVSPFMWKELFSRVPSESLGLNIDPSHLIWQQIDVTKAVHDFKDRIVLAQAKDTEILPNVLREEGMLSCKWWRHRVPGQGAVDWNQFITALHEIGYDGILSIEHEDPIWSGTDEKVEKGLLFAKHHLEKFM
ncbi:sugar phosphate isomerase/epimerase family protein [Lederbergia graminis]|uniref:Sugar phosphate isomerase/epimerase family protein n=2 Tax=Lederbergia graminis TaxID=735518 RepID=A0ABW0LFS7_9BACI